MNELNKGIIYSHGFDKEGRPVLIISAAKHNSKNRSIEELAKAILWMIEIHIKRIPENLSKYTILLDRTNAGTKNQDIAFLRRFSKLFQDQHPERLHRVIVYPSGLVFWSLWNIVKWFVSPVTRDKVYPVMHLSGVQEFIDDENIPASMVSHLILIEFFLLTDNREGNQIICMILLIMLIHTQKSLFKQ